MKDELESAARNELIEKVREWMKAQGIYQSNNILPVHVADFARRQLEQHDSQVDLRTALADARETLEHYAKARHWRERDFNESGMASTVTVYLGNSPRGYDRAAECLKRISGKGEGER